MSKYHIALSFAGEEREYVESVAASLRDAGVDVFYDRFEEADLWGKDLYTHLSSVYQDQAMFTVMFVSEAYRDKLWGNHERQSAQARAFSESREYILPAFFDVSVEVPGLLKTTGYIDLNHKTPQELADLIVTKLVSSGVELKNQFGYSDEAKQDVDYPLTKGSKVSKIITKLKSYNWYTQNPAVEEFIGLPWDKITSNEAFVLGRNLYQCACGDERRAVSFFKYLRRELALILLDRALDLLNGMFFEVYFNSEGEFRGKNLKGRCLHNLLNLQGIKKFEPSISFIRRVLEPYKSELPFRPNETPEKVNLGIEIKRGDPLVLKSVKFGELGLLIKDESPDGRLWRLSFQSFTMDELKEQMSEEWSIPANQLCLNTNPTIKASIKLRLPKNTCIRWPE